jgi:hypothetical protein
VRAASLTPVLMGLLEKDPAQRFDVQTARTMLRQQLAGPLASKAPPHMMTDPYSVVPAQRPPAAETQAIPPALPVPEQIGGRAMLAPGDSLSGHLAKVSQGGRRRAREEPADLSETMAGDPTSVIPPRRHWDGARAASEPLPGTVTRSRNVQVDQLIGRVKETGGKAVTTVQGWSRNRQLATGGAALGVVVLLIVSFSVFGGGGGNAQPQAQPSAPAQSPAAFETQDYKGDGAVAVKVPKGWTRSTGGTYVDYTDPDDAKHKVRVLVEPNNGSSAETFFKSAESRLKDGKSANCPKPYSRVSLNPQSIAGHDGAILEYKCGAGTGARHGLWAAVLTSGHAYSFFLTSTESQFDASKPIFDQMLATYKLAAA